MSDSKQDLGSHDSGSHDSGPQDSSPQGFDPQGLDPQGFDPQDFGPNDPRYYAPPRTRVRHDHLNRGTSQHEIDRPPPHESVAHFRQVKGHDPQNQKPRDIFAEAVARVERQSREPQLVEAPFFLQDRPLLGSAARFAIAVSGAILVALVYFIDFPTWQSPKSSMFSVLQREPAPILNVHDNSGTVNETLRLGVSVETPAPGASVTIRRLPTDARLTAGSRLSASEWRVPAQEIADAAIIPPTDFVGEMNLYAELRNSDNAALVATFVRLTWTLAPTRSSVVASASTAEVPPGPVAPEEQLRAIALPPPTVTKSAAIPSAATAPAETTSQARGEPIMQLSPNEVASLVRRAQELLASGDLQVARTFLTRAAEAHDARAALLLAKTFDPIVSRQSGVPDVGPDLAQARNWYQRARELGSPEAQRQLDALASYRRR